MSALVSTPGRRTSWGWDAAGDAPASVASAEADSLQLDHPEVAKTTAARATAEAHRRGHATGWVRSTFIMKREEL
jgi:hypothetical protein